tara:strand:- start:412 stop:1062 length:651 start_codon:yes stop_codon:yes gene_type:complete
MITINFKKRFFTSVLLFCLLFLVFNNNYFLVFTLLVLGIISLLEFFKMSKKIFKNSSLEFLSNTFFTIYVFLFSNLFFYFSNFFQIKIIIFIILLGCIASDIGGYVFGKIFKGAKLTKISPNKTISGALGSIFCCCSVIFFLIYYFINDFSFSLILIGIITSIFCQLGDIFFSFLKRKSKVKDTGNFLPGHGGVLDRLDGIFIALPIGFITLILLY